MTYNFIEVPNRRKQGYDGFSYNGKQLQFSRSQPIKFDRVNVYTDKESNCIKLEHDKNGKFKLNGQGNFGIARLPVPNGRYVRVKEIDVNGGIYKLATPKEQL